MICHELFLLNSLWTAFHARARGSFPGLVDLQMFLPYPLVKRNVVGSLRDREVACSTSDRQGTNFESCVWRAVSSHSSHHPQEVLLAQFSLYVHKSGLKPDSFFFMNWLDEPLMNVLECSCGQRSSLDKFHLTGDKPISMAGENGPRA